MIMRKVAAVRLFIIVLLLMMLAINAPAVLAQVTRSVEVWPTRGRIGDTVTVIGKGFNKSTADNDKYAAIFFSSQEATTSDDIDDEVTVYKLVGEGVWLDEKGEFETTFVIPSKLDDGKDEDEVEDVVTGTYYIYVCHYYLPNVLAPRIRAVAEFVVSVGKVELNPDNGSANTLVEISGSDFSANTSFTVHYDGSEVDVESGDYETDSQGEFVSSIRVPESTAGVHTVTVNVPGGEVEAEFTVQPEISLSTTSGEAGDTVTVAGTGFGRRKEVAIYFNDQGVTTETTDVRGSFSTTFTVPELAAGIYGVAAEDEDSNLATWKFTVVVPPAEPPPTIAPPLPVPPTISINPTKSGVGAQVAVSGAGFEGDEAVTVAYDGTEVATAITDAKGFFTATFKVPASKYGVHTITVNDGTTAEFTFTVESEEPPAPKASLPEAGERVKPPVSFAWEEVTDDSLPVTYDLQIATSEAFSAASVVLEKKGLSKSEYALTETEASQLAEREASYYWRVRAIDGASNEGEWSVARQFYVASAGLPEWVIYIIAGIGGALLGLIAVWLLLRTRSKKGA